MERFLMKAPPGRHRVGSGELARLIQNFCTWYEPKRLPTVPTCKIRIDMDPQAINPDTLLTSHEVGVLLQLNASTVVKWVNDGILPAYRTAGGHRRIRSADLLAFLKEQGMFVPKQLRGAGPRKVFMIDDDKALLTSFSRAVRTHKDRVDLTTFDNGIEALLRIGGDRPDAVILDVNMPGLDGFEVLKRIKENESTKAVEVVVVTGNNEADLEKKLLALGARAVLKKPVSPADVVELVTTDRNPFANPE
jgi:excisionase family DNA binding protein